MTESHDISKLVETDHRLEQAAEKSGVKLGAHRWHWTLDETNAERMSIYAYARAVGRGESTIRDDARGYAVYLGLDRGISFGDAKARAKLQGDTLVAAEAVAESRGVSLDAARKYHSEEIRTVKNTARERAERHGTNPSDEIQHVAQQRERSRQAEISRKQDQRARHTHRYIIAEGKISSSMRDLRSLLDETAGVEFSAEERELLADAIGQLRALLNLLDVRLTGAADIDWDAEMAKITEGGE